MTILFINSLLILRYSLHHIISMNRAWLRRKISVGTITNRTKIIINRLTYQSITHRNTSTVPILEAIITVLSRHIWHILWLTRLSFTFSKYVNITRRLPWYRVTRPNEITTSLSRFCARFGIVRWLSILTRWR